MAIYRKVPCQECKDKMLVDQFLCEHCDCGFVLVVFDLAQVPDKLVEDVITPPARRQ